jgi:molecular chaperone DnaJ
MFEQPEQTGVNLYIPFDEIERGSEKEYEVQRYRTCENCKGTGGDPGSKIMKCPQCNGSGNVHVQQNTMFGRFSMVTTCNKCRGRGKSYEKTCRECRGNGKILVKEKFRVKVDSVGKENKDGKKGRFWVF